MAINSTHPPSGAAALAAQPGAASAATAKLPACAPGTPVFAPEGLPSAAKGGVAQLTAATPSSDPQTPGLNALQGRPDPGLADLALADGKAPAKTAVAMGSDSAAAQDPASNTPGARTRSKGSPARLLPNAAQSALTPQLPAGQPFAAAADTAAPAATGSEADHSAGAPAAVMDATGATAPAMPSFAPQTTLKAPVTPLPASAAGTPPAAAPATASPAPLAAATSDTEAAQAPTAKLADITALPAGSTLTPRGSDAASTTDTSSPDPSALATVLSTGHTASDSSDAAHTAAPSPPAALIHTPVGTSGWAEQIGARLVWMAHQGVTAASLRMEPEHLGPVEVRISVRDDGTSVWFGASQPETRAALEQALPQLKELFSAQGMTLTDAGVSREAPRETPQALRGARVPNAAEAPENATSLSLATPRRGLVDTYA